MIAANAGGAWTPIGDVTTTMLWIHGQISTLQTVKVKINLFLVLLLLSQFLYWLLLCCHFYLPCSSARN